MISSILRASALAHQAEPVRVTVGDISNGYSVQLVINEIPVPGLSGNQSEAVQLFDRNDDSKARAGAEFTGLFSLVPGRNTIRITFKPLPASTACQIEFYVRSPTYTVPLLEYSGPRGGHGVIDTVIDMQPVMAKDFRTPKAIARDH